MNICWYVKVSVLKTFSKNSNYFGTLVLNTFIPVPIRMNVMHISGYLIPNRLATHVGQWYSVYQGLSSIPRP